MARPQLRAVDTPPGRTPARAVLAEAIAALADFEAGLIATRAAHATANEAAWAAQSVLSAAEKALPEVQAAALRHAVDMARRTATGPAPSVSAARAAVQAATDDLATARGARDALAAEADALEPRRSFPADRLNAAALAVLAEAPAVARIVAEIAELQRGLVDRGSALEWLAVRGVVPTGELPRESSSGMTRYAPARLLTDRFFSPPASWGALIDGPEAVPGAAPWVAALEALKVDADAALPD